MRRPLMGSSMPEKFTPLRETYENLRAELCLNKAKLQVLGVAKHPA